MSAVHVWSVKNDILTKFWTECDKWFEILHYCLNVELCVNSGVGCTSVVSYSIIIIGFMSLSVWLIFLMNKNDA